MKNLRQTQLLPFAALLLAAGIAQAQECPVEFVPDPGGPYNNPVARIGLDGSGYSKTGLAAPEEVALGVKVKDLDQLLVYCGGNCSAYIVPGVWKADWKFPQQPLSPGAFVRSDGSLDAAILDADNVLYLPPSNLALGETRFVTIKAKIKDNCTVPGYEDPNAKFLFLATVTRTVSDTWSVTVDLLSIDIPFPQITDCYASSSPCTFGGIFSPHTRPFVAITEYPATMAVGDLRMFRSRAGDLDQLFGECGTPTIVGSSGGENYCDDITYDWKVKSGTGSGIFHVEGDSAIFEATAPGTVKIQLKVDDGNGETTRTAVTINIQ